jgi:hypothetical protein
MEWIPSLGCFCLGALIGVLVRYYVSEAEKMTLKVLASSISVLAGSGVIGIFHLMDPNGAASNAYWFYPVGLLVGFAVVAIIEMIEAAQGGGATDG